MSIERFCQTGLHGGDEHGGSGVGSAEDGDPGGDFTRGAT